MEVRLSEVSSASLGEVRPPITTSSAPTDDEGAQYSRLAHTAAKVLDVPFACISVPFKRNSNEHRCYGPGADSYADFVYGLRADARDTATIVGPAEQFLGGDGAVIRSYLGVPLAYADESVGIFCVFDYQERTFSLSERRLLRQFADLAEGELAYRLERMQFEYELRKSRDQAEEMSKLKSVFLTNISHETRTPLTTILGFAEILEEEVAEEQREFVHLIQQGGKRLLDTLMSILDLARLESSSFRFEPEYFDMGAKIFDTCLLLEPLAQDKGLTLKVNLPQKPIKVFLDVSAVERTVSNLVSNAIKFTSEGGISVSLEGDDTDVLIHVADTGIGIGSEFMPHLFDEFKQESEGLARVHEGSGLGLPITKRLVELMKGKIMADSEKGYGSVFTVALPKNGEAKRAGANGHSSGEAARARVLVVEDNADTRTLVNHLLRKSYDVACASNGEEALELAAESSFDVLLVDINLGKGKSGEDVLHEVKKLTGYEDTPIIAVTAYAMPGDKERFFAEGFDDYVSKPFSKQRLLEALESVLE